MTAIGTSSSDANDTETLSSSLISHSAEKPSGTGRHGSEDMSSLNLKAELNKKMISDMGDGNSTMCTDLKAPSSRNLSEFDDKNEILTAKDEDSCEEEDKGLATK